MKNKGRKIWSLLYVTSIRDCCTGVSFFILGFKILVQLKLYIFIPCILLEMFCMLVATEDTDERFHINESKSRENAFFLAIIVTLLVALINSINEEQWLLEDAFYLFFIYYGAWYMAKGIILLYYEKNYRSQRRIIIHLREIRNTQNVDINQLAEIVQVRVETILKIENGIYIPSLDLSLKLATALDVPVEELFQLKQKKKKEEKSGIQ